MKTVATFELVLDENRNYRVEMVGIGKHLCGEVVLDNRAPGCWISIVDGNQVSHNSFADAVGSVIELALLLLDI